MVVGLGFGFSGFRISIGFFFANSFFLGFRLWALFRLNTGVFIVSLGFSCSCGGSSSRSSSVLFRVMVFAGRGSSFSR